MRFTFTSGWLSIGRSGILYLHNDGQTLWKGWNPIKFLLWKRRNHIKFREEAKPYWEPEVYEACGGRWSDKNA